MSVTDEQVAAFRQEIEDTEVNTQPLISDLLPFECLLVEFEAGDQVFTDKLKILAPQFRWYRKSRGDGNCFFRSFAFRFFEWFCSLSDFHDRLGALEAAWWSLLGAAGFDKIAYEDFLEDSIRLLRRHHDHLDVIKAAGDDPSDYLAQEWRNDPLKSNTMVIVLRMLVSAHLQLAAEEYIPFIYDRVDPSLSSTKEIMADYCRRNVEAIGVESDQIHIIAMTKIFGIAIEIVYLDASQDADNMVMRFGEGKEVPISLLYRPGHYDIVYRQ